MALKLTASSLADTIGLFRHYKQIAGRAMAQVSDAQLSIQR